MVSVLCALLQVSDKRFHDICRQLRRNQMARVSSIQISGKLKSHSRRYSINKVLLENRRIYSSAARMNDYYVKDSDVAQKQYTMVRCY